MSPPYTNIRHLLLCGVILIKYNYYLKAKDIFRFLLVGGLNAAVYLCILLGSISLTKSYYISVAIAQVLIAVIAFLTFSKYHFNSRLNFYVFVKFLISNIILFFISIFVAWVSSLFQFGPELFGIVNILVVAPLSYCFNTFVVFPRRV